MAHLDFNITYNLALTPDEFRHLLDALRLAAEAPANASAEEKERAVAVDELRVKLLTQRSARAKSWAEKVAGPALS